MSEKQYPDYSAVCAVMEKAIHECEFRISQSDKDAERLSKLNECKKMYVRSIELCDYAIESIKPYIKDIGKYLTDKKEASQLAMNNALRVAGEIFPASMSGVQWHFEEKEAWLEGEGGTILDRVEGSGYRGTTSVFLRATTLGSNQDWLQTLMLDEPLAKVSTERTAMLSAYLPIIGKNQQVILIEQKKEIYSNIESAVIYRFVKTGNYTTVTKEQ